MKFDEKPAPGRPGPRPLVAFGVLAALSMAVLIGCVKPRATPIASAQAAPPFSLPDEHGRTVTLASLLERGPAVVVFYRGHW